MKRKITLIIGMLVCLALNACTESNEKLIQSRQAIMFGTIDRNPEHSAVVSLYMDPIPYSKLNEIRHLLGPDDGLPYEVFCTGTLITPDTVLTAAHCLDNVKKLGLTEYMNIRIGTNPQFSGEAFPVRSLYLHPDYDRESIRNDIGLVKLQDEVPPRTATAFSVLPATLALDSDVLTKKKKGYKYPAGTESRKFPAQTVGYGLTEDGESGIKRIAGNSYRIFGFCSGKKHPDDVCEILVSDFLRLAGYPRALNILPKEITEYANIMSTYIRVSEGGLIHENYSTGNCSGDSGGPLFVTVDGKKYVAGVTSYGDKHCRIYGVHTAVWVHWENFIKPLINPDMCVNKVDDNNDGKIDCNDPLCAEDPVCLPEICDNQKDDNKNGKIDCQDPDCAGAVKCMPEICDNQKDDNDNQLSDCKDPQCKDFVKCKTEICDNDIDDNQNGLKDCEESRCKVYPHCKEKIYVQEICTNRIDDNKNGKIDCQDPECKSNPLCMNKKDIAKHTPVPQTPKNDTKKNDAIPDESCSVRLMNRDTQMSLYSSLLSLLFGVVSVARKRYRMRRQKNEN